MVKKSNSWNLQELQETLVKDTEQNIEQGFKEIANDSVPSGSAASVESLAVPQQPKDAEPTKGVQTYIPISQYRRLLDIKLTSGENIADLAAQAIELWLDVQEGKVKVNKVI